MSKTKLEIMADNGDLNGIKTYIENGGSLDEPFQYGMTALHIAAKKGHLEVVKYLVDQKVDIEARIITQQTALVEAGYGDHLPVVRFLLEKGANPNVGNHGIPLITTMVGREQIDIVRLLLEHGVDPNIRSTKTIPSPYDQAVEKGLVEILQLLRDHGLRVTKAKATKSLVDAAENCHYEITKYLVESFKISLTDFKKPDDPRQNLIHIATRKSCKNLVKFYLEKGVDVDGVAVDFPIFNRSPPLGIALCLGFEKLAEFLLKSGADINRYEPGGYSALGGAIENNNINWVKQLVELDADVNACCCGNDAPYAYAEMKGYLDISQYLLSKGAVDPIPLIAIEAGISVSSLGLVGYERLESFVSDTTPEYEGRNAYSFGWIYEGLAAIDLVPLPVFEVKQFFEKHNSETIVYLHPLYDKKMLGNIDRNKLQPFIPENTHDFCVCRYRIVDQKSGAFVEPAVFGMLRPGKRALSSSNIDLFIEKIAAHNDMDAWLSGSCAILDPYRRENFPKIISFINDNRTGELVVEITKVEV